MMSMSAEDFTKSWRGDQVTLDTLYTGVHQGKEVMPDAEERQEALVALTLDVGLELIVLEALDERTSVALLERQGLLKKGAEKTINEFTRDKSDFCTVKLVEELGKKHQITTSADLATDDKIATFHEDIAKFKAEWDDFWSEVEDYRNGWANKPPSPPKVSQPEDPRIKNFQSLYGNILSLRETGAKLKETAEDKVKRRKGPWRLSDINRLTIVPHTPEASECYIKLLKQHLTGTAASNEDKEHMYTGLQRVRPGGCMQRQCLVALTQGCEVDPQDEATPKGGVGEIKILSPRMLEADLASHRSYQLFREMEDERGVFNPKQIRKEYTQADDQDKQKTKLAYIKRHLSKVRDYYSKIKGEYKIPENLLPPSPPKDKPMTARELTHAYHSMLELNRSIYLKAAELSDGPWKRAYVERAMHTRAELMDHHGRGQINYIPLKDLESIASTLDDPPKWHAIQEEVMRAAGSPSQTAER